MLIIIPAVLLILSGCASTKTRVADFSAANARIDMAIESADPATKRHLVAARDQLKTAIEACETNGAQLEQAIRDKNDAIKDAEYWKQKQRKALKELWFWRGALIVAILFAARGPIFWIARKLIGIPW
ncbi:hypothetical protein EBR03_10115 [bacterium]|nr:hypothetical protein [bacterium]NBW99911.1 hypothetical protein [bacterium]